MVTFRSRHMKNEWFRNEKSSQLNGQNLTISETVQVKEPYFFATIDFIWSAKYKTSTISSDVCAVVKPIMMIF